MNARESNRCLPTEEGQLLPSSRASLLVRLIMGRWTLKILAELSEGGRRYQELHDALGGISHKVLTDTLRRAERDGLVMRHVDGGRVRPLPSTASLSSAVRSMSHLPRSIGGPLRIGIRSKQPDNTGPSAVSSATRFPPLASPSGTGRHCNVRQLSLKWQFCLMYKNA